MKLAKRLVISALIFGVLAVAVDRTALAIWRWRVRRYYEALSSAVAALPSGPPSAAGLVQWSGGRHGWHVPLLSVSLTGPVPSSVLVDGSGGLSLTFAPPVAAWSRHVPYLTRRTVSLGSEVFPYNDVYFVRVSAVEGHPGGLDLSKPIVSIEHGLPF